MGSWVADHGGSSGRQTWAKVFAELAASDTASGLDVDDLQRPAVSAHLVGRVEDSVRAWERGTSGVRGGRADRARHPVRILVGLCAAEATVHLPAVVGGLSEPSACSTTHRLTASSTGTCTISARCGTPLRAILPLP